MRFIFILLFILFGLPANHCLADILYLKNGDRLTGSIIRMENAKLTFWSKYAGEITLFWQDVERVEMDDTSKVIFRPPPKKPAEERANLDILPPANSKENDTPPAPELIPEEILAINPKPIVPIKITAEANGKLTEERGNTNKDVYYVNGKFTARTKLRRYVFDGEYEKEKKSNFLTEDNWYVHSKISHFVDKERYVYVDTLFENDKFKDLQLRSTYGAGAGYQFVEEELMNLSFSLGGAWVVDDFYLAEDKDFPAGQWALDFDRYLFRTRLQFFHSNKGYVSLENKEDWLVKSKTGLRFPLYSGFKATLQYEYEWDNEPASDAETEYDSTFMLLLGYEFKN